MRATRLAERGDAKGECAEADQRCGLVADVNVHSPNPFRSRGPERRRYDERRRSDRLDGEGNIRERSLASRAQSTRRAALLWSLTAAGLTTICLPGTLGIALFVCANTSRTKESQP